MTRRGTEATAAAAHVGHPLFARFYAWVSPSMERAGAADLRDSLLHGLTGRVIEVGAGNGLNFAHYPTGVTRVLAVEPEPHLRALAERAAAGAPVPIDVVDGVAEQLPAADSTFDAAVVSLVLCTIADPVCALAELHRVLRLGGELRFLEHTISDTRTLRRVQRVLDATVWPRLGGGCHTARDPAAAIRAAGFHVERIESLRFPQTVVPLPTSPHVLGVAVRGERTGSLAVESL